jgi:CheY-like chemotaxis protein
VQPSDAKIVLIVDDEFAIVEALTEILTWEGYTVRSVGNGRAALEHLATERVDVVLMDAMMPVMSGVEAARAMRADPRLDEIPIVLMTAGPLPDSEVRWASTLRKPFDLGALVRAMRTAFASVSGVARER